MRTGATLLGLGALCLLLSCALPVGSAHYVPRSGDAFRYAETVDVLDGVGDYTGYNDSTNIQGNLSVTSIAASGTESAGFGTTDHYSNSSGGSYHWSSSGAFTFSAVTFDYVHGTDNQTGYNGSSVWFFMNDSLGVGATFDLLDTPMHLESTRFDYALGTGAGAYVETIYAEGTGSYLRDDIYGRFTATYTWQAYFDPTTGYIVGYLYSEVDQNASGDGFTLVDHLAVTSTTYPLTPGPTPSTGNGSSTDVPLEIAAVVIVVVVVVVVIALLLRSRRRPSLPKHSNRGEVTYAAPPLGPAPPPVRLTPSDQPAVQQIVIKETVKVKCLYCGSLIDSTVTQCPYCGANRT